MKNLKKLLLCATFLTLTCVCANSIIRANAINTKIQGNAYNCSVVDKRIDTFNVSISDKAKEAATNGKKDSLKQLMIDDVRSFIYERAPKCNEMIPIYIVNYSLEHDMDISFVLAQAQYETCFGTAGAGRETSRHSIFGVNGNFKNYEESVVKYISLLKCSYLVNGKTEMDMLRNFVNKDGSRYSTNPAYETKLRGYYDNVLANTKLKSYQKQYRLLS